MQASALERALDATATYTERFQLLSGDEASLTGGDLGHLSAGPRLAVMLNLPRDALNSARGRFYITVMHNLRRACFTRSGGRFCITGDRFWAA